MFRMQSVEYRQRIAENLVRIAVSGFFVLLILGPRFALAQPANQAPSLAKILGDNQTRFQPDEIQLTITSPTNGQISIQWISRTNTDYAVEWKPRLLSSPWNTLTNLAGSGAALSASDLAGAPARFYRVVAYPIILSEKTLTPIRRAEDFAASEDGQWVWACMSLDDEVLLKLNAHTGEIVERFGPRESFPQCVFYQKGNLFVVADSYKNRGPSLMQFNADPMISLIRDVPIADWRLYRVSSARMSPDGCALWLVSSPGMSSLYGRVDSALFRVELESGSLLRILGPPPDKMDSQPGLELGRPMMLSVDEARGIFVSDLSALAVRRLGENGVELSQTSIEFAPELAPCRINRFLPIVGGQKGVVIDTMAMVVESRFELPGTATAICVDSLGTSLFVAIAGSSNVLKIDSSSGLVQGCVDLSRPGGIPGIADSTRGKDVSDIIALLWIENPPRLLALGFDGYIFIVATLLAETTEARQ